MRMKWREQLLAKTVLAGVVSLGVPGMLAAGTIVLAPNAMAQTQTGGLRVTVNSNAGAPVAGASVKVSSPDSLVTRTGTTGADGTIRIAGLDPATNYSIEIAATGFTTFTAGNVAVVSGRDLSVGYALGGTADAGDIVVITGSSLAAVDVTSATVGTTLTLDTVESLPTGRSYQSYLQLVPGVKPSSGGNPSSRSGVNYADVDGATGSSTDNVYYIDGVDVTDPTSGTFGSNFNSEIIQEQQVIVGGVPAEYAGGSGLISRVVTKSGSNEWHGSINYYFQNDGLVQKDEHSTSGGFSTYDAAVTLGGPIIKDTLWIFGSYQKRNRKDDVLNGSTGALMRSVENDGEYAFLKGTWQITPDDRLTATYFSDPTDISGSSASTTLNNRDLARTQGGDNYKVDYTRTFGDLLLNAYYFNHKAELTQVAADQTIRDNVGFRSNAGSTLAQRSQGGAGANLETHRDREEYGISGEYFLDTDFGSHTFKAGYTFSTNTYAENGSVPGNVTYASLAAGSLPNPTSWLQYSTGSGTATGYTSRSVTSVDNGRILTAINASTAAKATFGVGATGTVTQAQLDAMNLTNTTGNPYGNINVYRALRTISGGYEVQSEGQSIYLQDTWTLNQLTVNAGLRAEKWEHFDSNGETSASFDWDIAPRLSLVYDLFGDGRTKVFGFGGRYYDPVRNNMSDFAGALTGPVDEEQVNINGQWVTFRTRGGATTPDALFAPSTKTPYTDEFMLGFSTTFGTDIGLSVTATNRKTRDIMEDFDLALYSNPNGDTSHGEANSSSFFYLPYSYFGYSSQPNSNYVIGTLKGGKRDYNGLEVTLTKYKTDNWMGQVSYTYNDAKGNSNSDSNADYQGDWIALDPRAPNVYGPQAGNIKHQFKAYGSYEFDFGLETSAVFNWNSGALYTPAEAISRRFFPPMSTAYTYGGVTDTYFLPGYVGSQEGPDYYTFDMRFKYDLELAFGEVELFLDIFNVLNQQFKTSVEKQLAGSGTYAYQQANAWVAPRRAYLGARFSF
ncbi:MAG TPA: TonB-dependent receptor [Hyphomonadaceae bacterium]|nr:TonB-dependent receptor [Hyphomonadaceae bacterium]